MSQIIAIAGAGKLGKHIVDAILEDGKHKLVILSRGANQELADRGIEVRTVDYSSVTSLTEALAGVNVVVSFVTDVENKGYQFNLFFSAEAAGVRRFIPSEWAMDVKKFDEGPAMYDFKKKLRHFLSSQDKVEYTLVCNGLFMDYLLPKGGKKYCGDVAIPVNIEERKARIPGSGEEPVTLTLADDVGKAIVWLINDPRPWPKYTYIAGSVTSWNELVKMGEEVTGDKFTVEYIPEAELHKRHQEAIATGDPLKAFYAEIDIWYGINGTMALAENEDPTLFRGINFVKPKDLVQYTYGK